MKNVLFAAMAVLVSSISMPAMADIIDDNLVKAERSVVQAQNRLQVAKDCVANRVECLATIQDKANKALIRAQKRVEAANKQ